LRRAAEPIALGFDVVDDGGTYACVTWRETEERWVVEDNNVTTERLDDQRIQCNTTHLSAFAVAELVSGGKGRGACARLREKDPGLYSSGAYQTWLTAQALGWLFIGADAAMQFSFHASQARGLASLATVQGVVAATFAALALPRAAYLSWSAASNDERRVCFELLARPALALYDVASPFLLAALSAIVCMWLQLVEGKARGGKLVGKFLRAFGLWNGLYVVVGVVGAAATIWTDDPEAALWIARATLAYGAAAHFLQGCAFVFAGQKLVKRLGGRDSVAEARDRVRRLLRYGGAAAVGIAATEVAFLSVDPTPRAAFGLVAILRRGTELVLAAAAAGLSMSGSSTKHRELVSKLLSKSMSIRRPTVFGGAGRGALFGGFRPRAASDDAKAVELGEVSVGYDGYSDKQEVVAPPPRRDDGPRVGWALPSLSRHRRRS